MLHEQFVRRLNNFLQTLIYVSKKYLRFLTLSSVTVKYAQANKFMKTFMQGRIYGRWFQGLSTSFWNQGLLLVVKRLPWERIFVCLVERIFGVSVFMLGGILFLFVSYVAFMMLVVDSWIEKKMFFGLPKNPPHGLTSFIGVRL